MTLKPSLILGVLSFLFCTCKQSDPAPERMRVSDNGHYLVDHDDQPFYWIGDTGWAMFQRLSREQVDQYLDDRAQKGFTVIQSVAFWYPHGPFEPIGPLNEVNFYGYRPFAGSEDNPDTTQPMEDYWEHADYIVQAVKHRGMKLALLPCWANAFVNNRMPGSKIVFTEQQAAIYGQFLGERYRLEPHIIWVLGGDVDPVNFGDQDQRAVYRAMAEGIGRGVSGNLDLHWNVNHADWDETMMTFHAVRTPSLSGEGAEGGSSSIWFHQDAWLDFNMMETFRWLHRIYPYVTEDYRKKPVKPTLLGEGAYETGKYKHECGFITPIKVRRQGYHALFAGAIGYTYGHWAIWPFKGAYCEREWHQALDAPGAMQIAGVMREFVASHNIFDYYPDQSLLINNHTGGKELVCALVNRDQTKALVYFPNSEGVSVDLSMLPPDQSATWFDPRNGNQEPAYVMDSSRFIPPFGWEDAVLILR